MPVEWAVGEVSRLSVGFLQLYEYAPAKEPSQSFSYAVLYLRIPNSCPPADARAVPKNLDFDMIGYI